MPIGALKGVLGLLTMACVLVGGSIAVLCADEYREALRRHRVEIEKASVYLSESAHCKNRVSRLKLDGFDKCTEAEGLLSGPPAHWRALVEVAGTLPPVIQGAVNAVRADMFKIGMTLAGAAVVWSVMRRWLTPARPQQQFPFMLPTTFTNHAYKPYAAPNQAVVWGNPNSVRVMDY